LTKRLVAALLTIALSSPALSPVAYAATAQIVALTLQDSSVDPSNSGMVIKADPTKVKAGRVTLEAVNRSKDLVHEVLVVPAPSDGMELPYDTNTNTIIEKRVHSLGEISELKPGARGKLTLNLKAGTYLLLCNQPGHYKAGMSTKLVVER
jgi:uncharacterized cupredoxin-like copper-binding protein